jgi:hypothetical protein
LKPFYPFAYNNRGVSKYFLGDFSSALNDHSIAIEQNPQYIKAYVNRGHMKILLGSQKEGF